MPSISPCGRYGFVAIPKTGSQSMYTALNSLRWKRIGKYHGASFATEGHNPDFVFCVVRDPYERIFSHYWFESRWEKRKRVARTYGWDFERYLFDYVKEREKYDFSAGHLFQTDWIKHAGVTHILKLEDFPDALDRLPFWKPGTTLGRMRKTGSGKPKSIWLWDEMSQDYLELINDLFSVEFEQLEYERYDGKPGRDQAAAS